MAEGWVVILLAIHADRVNHVTAGADPVFLGVGGITSHMINEIKKKKTPYKNPLGRGGGCV